MNDYDSVETQRTLRETTIVYYIQISLVLIKAKEFKVHFKKLFPKLS